MFLTLWTYVKKYWQIIILVAGIIVGTIMFTRQDKSYAERLKELQDSHDREILDIATARAEEQRQHAENEKKLQDALKTVQAHYDDEKREFDAKKKEEIEDIVKRFSNDPNELAKQLSAATGFRIVLPE